MTFTQEPRGLLWINNVNSDAVSSLTGQLVWVVGSFALTLADYKLLLGATEMERQAGIFLAGILVTAWTGKTVAGVFDRNNKRKADPRYADVLEAKERGQVAGAAAAAAAAQVVQDAKVAGAPPQRPVTGERPAMQPSTAAPIIPDEELIPEGGQP